MSILIKGMAMPKQGMCKTITIFDDGAVVEGNGSEKLGIAVPVPPHGDLIEREALMDDIIGSMVFSGREVPKEVAIVRKVLDIIGDANAIIPEEEEEQE